MTASQLQFNGKLTARPGDKTKLDASAFDAVKLGATGIVALLGTAEGGIPYTAIRDPENDVQRATNSGKVRSFFRSGNLRELGSLMFSPAKDDDIPGGAQQVVFLKVNPSVAGTATFANTDGNALQLTARDYGAFTNQIKATIANASTGSGKLVSVSLDSTVENFDLIGNSAKFSLLHATGSTKPTTVTVTNTSTLFRVDATRLDLGQDSSVVQAAGGSTLEILSANVADTTQTVTVYGLDASNVPKTSVVTLNGTSPVALAGTWNLTTALTLSAAAAGNVTLRISGAGATVVVLTPGQTNRGRVVLDIPCATGYAVKGDAATTRTVVVRGVLDTGVAFAERLVLTGTINVTSIVNARRITAIEVMNLEVARTVNINGLVIATATAANFPTLAKLRDYLKSNPDFTFTDIAGNLGELTMADLDFPSTATNILSPTTGSFFARLYDIVKTINDSSQLVKATRLAPGTGAPTNTSSSIFLAGGHEGDILNPGVATATFADWQAALDLLKEIYKNTIVPMTSDASVHAAGSAHCEFMCGEGEQECDMVVGAAVDETRAQLKTRILALNTRHVRLCGQEVLLPNTAGTTTWQPPWFQAGLCAAAQAGCDVGTPLTNKVMNVLGVRQSTDWNPKEEGEEMLMAGLWFMQRDPDVGIKVVRNITTYKVDSNLVYTEASMNQAANRAAQQLRTRMNAIVGKKNFAKTLNSAKAAGDQVLESLVRDEIIAAYDKPAYEITGDKLPMSVGLAIISPTNFIPITINLRPFSLTG